MKINNIIVFMLLLGGLFFSGCEDIEVTPLEYSNSSFKEVRMFLREISDDHASSKDLTVSSTIVENGDSVIVMVKTDTDITKLYGIAKLEDGCTVEPVGNAPAFGMVADFSQPYSYLVKSADGQAREWIVAVKVAPPPPEVTDPTGFEIIYQDGSNKHIAFASEAGELQFFNGKFYGHSYDGSAEGFSKLVDDPALSFKNTGDFSIAFWVSTTASNSDPSMMGTQSWASSGNTGFTFAFRGDNWRVAISDGLGHKADARTQDLGIPFNDGGWHLLVVTCDRDGNMTMYQDGAEVASEDMSEIGDIDSGMPIHIAQDGTGAYGDAFTGDIAGSTIYDYVLTVDEISELAGQ